MRTVRPNPNGTQLDQTIQGFPLLLPALAFATGIAVYSEYNVDPWINIAYLCSIAAILVGLAGFAVKLKKPISWYALTFILSTSVLWLAAGFLHGQYRLPTAAYIDPVLLDQTWKLKGIVIRSPQNVQNDRAYVWVELISLGNDSAHVETYARQVLFYNIHQLAEIRERDTLFWDGRIQALQPKPELASYFQWLHRNRVVLKGNILHLDRIGRPTDLQSHFQDLQQYLRNFLTHTIKDSTARSLSEAMLLGIRSDLSPDLRQTFVKSGLAHLLALSGAHVGILIWLLWTVRKLLSWHPLGRTVSALTLGAMLVGFPLLTGLSPSVVRACGMALIYLVGRTLYRNQPLLQVLACMALIQLVIEPELIQNIGFQLSYAAVLGIGLLLPPIRKRSSRWLHRLVKRVKFRRLGSLFLFGFQNFIDVLTLSWAAQMFTVPLVLIHFGTFPVYFLIANILAWPISFIALTSGFLLLLFRRYEWAIDVLEPVHCFGLKALAEVAERISSLPAAQLGPMDWPPRLLIVIWCLMIALGLWVQVYDSGFSLKRKHT